MNKNKVVSLEGIKKGIDIACNAVGSTLGSSGRNIIYRNYTSAPVVTNDGITILRNIRLEDEEETIGVELVQQASERQNEQVGDGPQDLNSKILTPKGWKRMGDIKVDDSICGTNGTIQRVLGVFPKGKLEKYKVYFSGNSIVNCCINHLWTVSSHKIGKQVLPLSNLIDDYEKLNKDNTVSHKYYVETSNAEFEEKKDLMPIDSYLLGLLLGDGSLTGKGKSYIELSLGKLKKHVFDKIIIPDGLRLKINYINAKNYYRVKIQGRTKEGKSMKDLIMDLGLLGLKSDKKFIPISYLFSSTDSRKKLLQGLVDTDAHVNKRGLFEFSSTSKKLADDFADLCRSLGKQISVREKSRIGCNGYSENPVFCVTERKGYRYGNKIIKIEKTNEFVEMQCIKVSNSDNLYFTDDYVLTHNTSTIAVLAQAMINKGLELIKNGSNPMQLRREMISSLSDIKEQIKKKSRKVESDEDLFNVANISMENPEIAKIIVDSVKQAGENGTVVVEESTGSTLKIESVDGIKFVGGYISPFMATNYQTMKAEMDNVPILVANKQFSTTKDMFNLLDELLKKNIRQMVIICNDVVGEMLSVLIANIRTPAADGFPVFRSVVIKTGIGTDQELLEDIALVTGGQLLDETNCPNEIEPRHFNYLGKARKVIVTKEDTLIIGGNGDKKKIEDKIISIREELKKAAIHNKEFIKQRLGQLVGKVVVLKVGAPTEAEMKYMKLKIDDAVASTVSAQEEGIVAGGGRCLYDFSLLKAETDGEKIVYSACSSPMEKIIENAGFESEKEIKKLKSGEVWNSSTYKIVKDPFKEGIIDPAKVERCALENAVSLAGAFLSSASAIVTIPKKDKTKE